MHLRVESNDDLRKIDNQFRGLYHHNYNDYFKKDKGVKRGIGLSKRGGMYWKVSIYTTIFRILSS